MISWLIDKGDKSTIYAPSELPSSRWEVQTSRLVRFRAEYLRCTARLLGWGARTQPPVDELHCPTAKVVNPLAYCGSSSSYCGVLVDVLNYLLTKCDTPWQRTQQPLDVLRRSSSTNPTICWRAAAFLVKSRQLPVDFFVNEVHPQANCIFFWCGLTKYKHPATAAMCPLLIRLSH